MKERNFNINEGILNSCTEDYSRVIVIPTGVKVIGKEVFEDFYRLRSVEMPNSVTHIEDWAFYICKDLKNVKMSNNLISIGTGAFAECVKLEGLVIPNSVKNIGEKAFAGCESLKKISLPNSVEFIGNEAFEDCYALESVIIPDSVKKIGKDAFSGCKKLTIYYSGSETQWNKVSTNDMKGIKIIFNSSNKADEGMSVHSSTSSNKESANSYFEKAFHNTNRTLNFVISDMQKAGYSKSDIVSAVLNVLGEVNWND